MSKVTDISEPASELERLIADLSESGLLVFVFGVGWWTAHLAGATVPVFRGPADRRRWHVELGGRQVGQSVGRGDAGASARALASGRTGP